MCDTPVLTRPESGTVALFLLIVSQSIAPGTGNITPNTSAGRWFCIAYVLLGIPLLSLFFGMTGYYLTQLLRLAILKVSR